MNKKFQFGSASAVSYTPRSRLLHWEGPRGTAIDDVRAAAAAALAAPLEFPPLRLAVVPGDKIVLALEPGVPQAPAIIAAVIEELQQGGATAEDVAILLAEGDPQFAGKDIRTELPAAYRRQVRLATHHPGAREDLSYLGADEQDQPIYMNRLIFDADVVVPIGCARLDGALGYGGVRATLYPTFADQAAYQRCRSAAINGTADDSIRNTTSRRSSRRATANPAAGATKRGSVSQHEAEHVAWLLGVVFTVQVVPGASDGVLHVLAGHLEEVLARAGELCVDAWSLQVPNRANLVVAAIAGDCRQQTWENVGRAITAAQRIVNDNGAIALCTELTEAPGPGMRAAATAENPQQAQRRLSKHSPTDAPTAEKWALALSRTRVYLLSGLPEDQVEELGAAHVGGPGEVARLIERSESCVLLESAQFVLPTAEE
jgi:nickel-dependent lactate racemase